ncbi:MAG: hypothetical protein PPP58_02920 [Natronomonas sp.]
MEERTTETELAAIHRIELGLEWLHKAHGALVSFHHNTGHAMDHFDEAEELLRETGNDDLADRIRVELLPRGVVGRERGGRWSYDVLESFESGLYDDVRSFEREAREQLTDGERHTVERRQEQRWRDRAREEHNFEPLLEG